MKNPYGFLLLTSLLYGCATSISGVVMDETNRPIKTHEGKINIHLLSPSTRPLSIVVDIDAKGEFSTNTNLTEGEYLVEPLIPGYRSDAIKLQLSASQKLTLSATKIGPIKPSTIGTGENSDVGKGAGEASLTPPNL